MNIGAENFQPLFYLSRLINSDEEG